ncbi:MAG: tetratricopeptide repeat protein [Planctomycetes bacterium]|nr:tetratricopeptide repeat protein [Planctomycetota bacterium]
MPMIDVAETLEVAVKHHRSGDLTEARRQYQQVLKCAPDNPDALHSLGLVAYQMGRYQEAVELISKAIENNPSMPQFYNNLGIAFKALKRFKEAVDAYQQALCLEPDFVDAYFNLGNALRHEGQYDEAIENHKQAIRLRPDYAEAYHSLGRALKDQGQSTEAIENYKMAIHFKPDYPDAYNNMAVALLLEGRFQAAIENCRQALLLKPGFAEAYNNMGTARHLLGQYAEAIENYERAIWLKPDYAHAHWNYSHVLLLKGKLAEGWDEYEWLRKMDLDSPVYPHSYQRPCWDGSSFTGKRLLVHYEQGIGDSFQFVRYLPMVKARGGTVIYEERKSLLSILRQIEGIDEVVEARPRKKPDVEFDYHASLLSLPGIFGTTLETIPSDIPYLYADLAKTDYWRSRLQGSNFKIGIVWAGSPKHENDHRRSCMLKHFEPLAVIDGVRLYSLQKDATAAQLQQFPAEMVLANPAEEFEDFADTAAVIENLDLVISVDTAIVHLAGAMGKSVWTLLPFAPDWRWMLDRDDSPWYPTMRLFRQEQSGDWETVFARVAQQLKVLVETRL